jgi:hypothetical protein
VTLSRRVMPFIALSEAAILHQAENHH